MPRNNRRGTCSRCGRECTTYSDGTWDYCLPCIIARGYWVEGMSAEDRRTADGRRAWCRRQGERRWVHQPLEWGELLCDAPDCPNHPFPTADRKFCLTHAAEAARQAPPEPPPAPRPYTFTVSTSATTTAWWTYPTGDGIILGEGE